MWEDLKKRFPFEFLMTARLNQVSHDLDMMT